MSPVQVGFFLRVFSRKWELECCEIRLVVENVDSIEIQDLVVDCRCKGHVEICVALGLIRKIEAMMIEAVFEISFLLLAPLFS